MKTNFVSRLLSTLFVATFLFSCHDSDNDDVQTPPPGNVGGVKIISCTEINDVNPLNNLSFTLKSTGQPLFDMVILFSSNINYDETLQRPYIHHNPEMTNILTNAETYIKPLKNKGIKVLLSLLGNWDRAGVANMADTTARRFAQEIKKTLDAYGLDGVMFDDEYSVYMSPPPPGFVYPSSEAAGRLLYETKQAIGDRMVLSFVFGGLYGAMPTINGVAPAGYIDYALSNYMSGAVSAELYSGMTNKQLAPWSQEFAQGIFLSQYSEWFRVDYKSVLEGGYGAHMLFSVDPSRDNFVSGQLPELQKMSAVICKDEVVYDGINYPADYK